jgi:hypothetical protein
VQFKKGLERLIPDYANFSMELFAVKQFYIGLDVSLFGIINSLLKTNHTTYVTL